MVTNLDRSECAEKSLQMFGDMVMSGELSEDTAQDLICNIGHFCRFGLLMSRSEIIALYATAIGCWSAEDRAPDGEPYSNDKVDVTIKEIAQSS